jgi:glycosyltransferase involved in cell wall biosynthesis
MWRQARVACRTAFAITGNAPQFVEWGLALASRTGTTLDRAFPHGYSAGTPDPTKVEESRAFWEKHGIRRDSEVFVACFFGAIGPQSELETVIAAARLLEQRGRRFKFVLCGRGDHLESLRRKSAGVSSVLFPGWVGAADIWALMRVSTVGLAVYRSNAGYITNLPNKPIEYLSAGLPIVSSLRGYLERFLADHGCGLTYPNGDAEALARVLTDLDDDRSRLAVMSANARRIFSEKFDSDKVYSEMTEYLQDVVVAYSTQSHSLRKS